ncbi:hypothetical protein GCM10027168_30370 [Streptomyces capparidis]
MNGVSPENPAPGAELDGLLRQALHEWPLDGVRPEPDLAGRVLRATARRRRARSLAVAGAAAAVVLTAAAVPALDLGGDGHRGAGPAAERVLARADESPPAGLVAAGEVAMSAYHTWRWEKRADGDKVRVRTWWLHDPQERRYARTPWAHLDVAPGMRTAAVLEKVPDRRVGIVDLATGKVTRWIPVDRPAGGLAWSPDGTRLAVTTYSGNPDGTRGRFRTGYYVLDAATGEGPWRALPPQEGPVSGPRQDIGWSRDGSLVHDRRPVAPYRDFYDMAGKRVPAPPNEAYNDWTAGPSPDGSLTTEPPLPPDPRGTATAPASGKGGGVDPNAPSTTILEGHVVGSGGEPVEDPAPHPIAHVYDTATGERVGSQRVQRQLVWADDEHLIAWTCDLADCAGKKEFRNRLVLVDVTGREVVPLTGFRENSQEPGAWVPLFTRR